MVLIDDAPRCRTNACRAGRMACPTPYACQRVSEAALDRRIAEKREARSLPELLLSTGALEGPFRRVRPLTVSPLMRVRRALRNFFFNRQGPNL